MSATRYDGPQNNLQKQLERMKKSAITVKSAKQQAGFVTAAPSIPGCRPVSASEAGNLEPEN